MNKWSRILVVGWMWKCTAVIWFKFRQDGGSFLYLISSKSNLDFVRKLKTLSEINIQASKLYFKGILTVIKNWCKLELVVKAVNQFSIAIHPIASNKQMWYFGRISYRQGRSETVFSLFSATDWKNKIMNVHWQYRRSHCKISIKIFNDWLSIHVKWLFSALHS